MRSRMPQNPSKSARLKSQVFEVRWAPHSIEAALSSVIEMVGGGYRGGPGSMRTIGRGVSKISRPKIVRGLAVVQSGQRNAFVLRLENRKIIGRSPGLPSLTVALSGNSRISQRWARWHPWEA